MSDQENNRKQRNSVPLTERVERTTESAPSASLDGDLDGYLDALLDDLKQISPLPEFSLMTEEGARSAALMLAKVHDSIQARLKNVQALKRLYEERKGQGSTN